MKFMKSMIAALAFTGLAASASAADLPARYAPPAPTVAYSVAPVFTWTGLYVGLNGGYAFKGDTDFTLTRFGTTTGSWPLGKHEMDGYTVGGHVGYNQQFGMFVVGLEGSASFANIKGSYDYPAYNVTTDTKINQLFTITPRIGVAFDRLMIYGKGGLALANVKSNASYTGFGGPLSIGDEKYQWGWTLGAGAEYAFSRNWSVGLEYNYIRLNSKEHTDTIFGTPVAISVKPDIHQARMNLNYRF